MSGFVRAHKSQIHVVNTYAPYFNRQTFWQRVVHLDILKVGLLIVVGDFNCTLIGEEGWGMHCQHDPLVDFIADIFSTHQLKDIRPHKLCPMWFNGRKGVEYIAKRLDRFLVQEGLLELMDLFKSSVAELLISNHRPIIRVEI